MQIKQFIFQAGNDWTGLIIRLTLGLILFPHGAQKALGWFNGYGFKGVMEYFTGTLHLPWLIGALVVLIEFVGAISLVLGFAGRLWAVAVIILFLGIIMTVHAPNGFFMNWFGNQKGEGFEFDLLMIGLAIAIILNGSGKWSVDGLWSASAR